MRRGTGTGRVANLQHVHVVTGHHYLHGDVALEWQALDGREFDGFDFGIIRDQHRLSSFSQVCFEDSKITGEDGSVGANGRI